jgi:hypothetical protein
MGTNASESANGSGRTKRGESKRREAKRHESKWDGSKRGESSRRAFLAWSAGAASAAGLAHVGLVGGATASPGDETTTDSGRATTTFTVRVENVSGQTTLETSARGDAMKQPVPLSPGVYAVHSEPGLLFTAGEQARENGLEVLAEDGMPMELAGALAERPGVSDSGAFATPVGGAEPAPIGPDGAYEFSAEAAPGERLSLATMFVQSNDLAEDAPVRPISDVGDGYSYPYASEVIRVTREVSMD